jgi:ATP-binding cassette subfamily B protein
VLRPLFARYAKSPGLVAVVIACMAYQAAYNLALSLVSRRVFDDVIPRRDGALLGVLAAAMVGALALRVALVTLQERTMSRLAARVITDLRLEMFARMHELPPRYFADKASGDLLARFSTDLGVVENAVSRVIPRGTFLTFNITACGALMVALDWRLAATIGVALILTLIAPRRLAATTARENARRRGVEASVLAHVQENLALKTVVRLFGLARWARDQHAKLIGELRGSAEAATYAAGMVEASTVVAFAAVQLLVLGVGAYFAITGGISSGVLVAFTALVATVAASMFGVSQVIPALIEAAAGAERVEEFLGAEADARRDDADERLPRLSRSVRFDDVSFSYTGERLDIDHVSLDIPAKTSVAIVGPSGSGKSTLLAMLMLEQSPASGALLVDGRDVARAPASSLFDQLSVVPQESLLFDIPVRENIRLGRLNATDAEVEDAAHKAEVHDVIMQMPRGYATPAGERGGKLSGGQRQRIAIARAVLRDPAILLLDEATSALDPGTEAAIIRTLAALRRGRTVVSVTHRLASVTDFDCIVVMQSGRIVENGTHAELLARRGVYAELWEKQSSVTVSDDGADARVSPDRLPRIPLFAPLAPAQLEAVANRFATTHFDAGSVIFRAGDPGDAFYVVARGAVRVELPGGRTRICTEGDFFGEIALLGRGERTATVRAETPATLLALARQHFEQLVAEHADVKAALERVAETHLAADSAAS